MPQVIDLANQGAVTARPAAQTRRRPCNLLLHMGASKVTRDEVVDTPTPRATRTWQPIPHVTVLNLIEQNLARRGLVVTNEAHGLTHDGSRYFGLLEIESTNNNAFMSRVVGIRNAHDKRFAAGIVAGAQVLVCDNLCFSGEIALSRKHTSHIMNDLPELAKAAVDKLSGYWLNHSKRVAAYKAAPIDDRRAHDIVIRSVDAGVMANSYIPKVLEQWREPEHSAFKPRTVWSLQNAYTEVFKGNVGALPERTGRLHDLLDVEVGFELTV